MTPKKTNVLAFQFEGCAYQPPAGDQTCLGYLVAKVTALAGVYERTFDKMRECRNVSLAGG